MQGTQLGQDQAAVRQTVQEYYTVGAVLYRTQAVGRTVPRSAGAVGCFGSSFKSMRNGARP